MSALLTLLAITCVFLTMLSSTDIPAILASLRLNKLFSSNTLISEFDNPTLFFNFVAILFNLLPLDCPTRGLFMPGGKLFSAMYFFWSVKNCKFLMFLSGLNLFCCAIYSKVPGVCDNFFHSSSFCHCDTSSCTPDGALVNGSCVTRFAMVVFVDAVLASRRSSLPTVIFTSFCDVSSTMPMASGVSQLGPHDFCALTELKCTWGPAKCIAPPPLLALAPARWLGFCGGSGAEPDPIKTFPFVYAVSPCKA